MKKNDEMQKLVLSFAASSRTLLSENPSVDSETLEAIETRAAELRKDMNGDIDQLPAVLAAKGEKFVLVPKGGNGKLEKVMQGLENLEKLPQLPKISGSEFILHKQDIRSDVSNKIDDKKIMDQLNELQNETHEYEATSDSFEIKQEPLDDLLPAPIMNSMNDMSDIRSDDGSIESMDSADISFIDVVGQDDVKIEPGQSLLRTNIRKTPPRTDGDL